MNAPVNDNSKKVLGLDIGSNSIGWCLLALEDNKPKRFIDIGSRIFNKGVEDEIPTPKNAKRRRARLDRRVIQRRSRRKRRLESYLMKLGFLPDTIRDTVSRERLLNGLGDPYELRSKGLDEKLDRHEFGRVLLHLVQRRGFLSNRKTAIGDLADDPDVMAILEEEDSLEAAEDKTEEGQFKQQIANLRESIKASGYRTLGEYLYRNEDLDSKRNRIRNGGDLRTDRAMYRQELQLIWNKQKESHADLTENMLEQIEEIIFFQRPLKFKADRIGKCSLEPGNKRSAFAKLEFQEFRYLQDVNNLSHIDPYTNKSTNLSAEQREKILILFEEKKNVTYPSIRKKLGFDKSYVFNLEAAENKKLKGNLTALTIAGVFPEWEEFDESTKVAFTEDMLTIKKRSTLFKRLQSYWNLTPEQSVPLCLLEFEEGHANLSLKAIRKLLPYMRKGMRYDEAREAAGYSYKDSDPKVLAKLPAPPTIPNPIVSRGLSEVRRLVNAIIKTHGKPDIIRVEMARDLEMNTKRYKQFESRQRKNTKANEAAEAKWGEVSSANPHLKLRKYPSRDDKIKFRLWEDQGKLCAYSCKVISMNQLFSDDVEVDHVVPYSFSLDDSYMNKVVCFARENRNKSQQTPIDAFEKNEEQWSQITGAIARWDRGLYSKVARFFLRSNEIEKDFTNSQLVDTRYIAKEALSYLALIGADVTTTKGVMTSWLRHHWGLNSLISESDKKDRTDHRQHAIDAAITACIDRPFYQALVKVAREIESSSAGLSMRDLHTNEPWDGFRSELDALIQDLIVSHQTSSKVQGALNEAFGVGYIEGVGTVYRKNVDPKLNVDKVIDPAVREILLSHLIKNNNKKKEAFAEGNPVYHKDNKTRIRRVRIKQASISFSKLEHQKMAIRDKTGRAFKWHAFGNTHCVRVFHNTETGKYESVFQTAAAAKVMSNERSLAKLPTNHDFLYTLHKNDIVRAKVDGALELFRIQKLGFANRRISLAQIQLAKEANPHTFVLNDENMRFYELEKVNVNVLGRLL